MSELEPGVMKERRRIEMCGPDVVTWRRGTMESGVSVDGRVKIRFDDDPEETAEVELAEQRYRYVLGEAVRDWTAADDIPAG